MFLPPLFWTRVRGPVRSVVPGVDETSAAAAGAAGQLGRGDPSAAWTVMGWALEEAIFKEAQLTEVMGSLMRTRNNYRFVYLFFSGCC